MTQPITNQKNEIKLALQRIEALERELAALRRRQLPLGEPPRPVRLAKTLADAASYPAVATGNTFEYVGEHLSFTKTPGAQSPTFTQQSAERHGVGKHPNSGYLQEGERVVAIDQANGHTLLLPVHHLLLAEVSANIVRRASGVCTSATATIWEINTSDTLAATSDTIKVYNPSGLPIVSGELILCVRLRNGKWIALEVMSAMRDFWYHAKLAQTTLASATAITTSTLTGGTVWATSTAFPVHFSSGQTLCNMPGYYRLQAVLYINSKWTQPDDNIHHWARITFQNYLGGSLSGTALGYANFSYPARRTSTDGAHDHPIPVGNAGDHHHTFDEIGDQYALVVLNGIVTKVGTTTQEISIRPTAITGSAGGPAIGDFGCATGSIELKPVGYGETLGAWVA